MHPNNKILWSKLHHVSFIEEEEDIRYELILFKQWGYEIWNIIKFQGDYKTRYT